MGKNLLIVESPAKAKTIEKYLGKDFTVRASYGHVRDLPKGDDAIDIENGFKPQYEVLSDKKNVIKELKTLIKNHETVWLATDEDREGEAISWHLAHALSLPLETTRRIVFNEITKSAITRAIQNPRTIDQNLVNAQQARRILDRLVGFRLSPVLWRKIRGGLSAGRVQSVAVRLIVEQERSILAFEPQSSYKVTAEFDVEGKVLKAELAKKLPTLEDAQAFYDAHYAPNNAVLV
ncbi:MAG: DNA topoisomerase, partial [Bacteroidota bacterium]